MPSTARALDEDISGWSKPRAGERTPAGEGATGGGSTVTAVDSYLSTPVLGVRFLARAPLSTRTRCVSLPNARLQRGREWQRGAPGNPHDMHVVVHESRGGVLTTW